MWFLKRQGLIIPYRGREKVVDSDSNSLIQLILGETQVGRGIQEVNGGESERDNP
jgi:hypothetical protein